MTHYLVFGTHPRLSLAEFLAVKPDIGEPVICGNAALVTDRAWDGPVLMNILGGTVKLGNVLGDLATAECTPERIADLLGPRLRGPSLDFGWSVFGGAKASHAKLSKLAIPFKKELKARGIASRWVTGEHGAELSPAAVAKLKLTTEGLDVCLLVHGETVSVGLSTDVQDADAWSLRDYGRPSRDEMNGMLPPKLARMMVNLAKTPENGVILDPFCGGGTIAMEAAIATHASQIISSDLEPKQIADAEKNATWLISQRILRPEDANRMRTIVSDVRRIKTHLKNASIDRVITEGYLGPPLRGSETQMQLDKNAAQISGLWTETLKALAPLLMTGGIVVGIWPAFKTSHGMARVDLTDALAGLGYESIEPWLLLYQRPDQKVARRIVILRKI
jgi:tRNA G10  N-methylase Trm11